MTKFEKLMPEQNNINIIVVIVVVMRFFIKVMFILAQRHKKSMILAIKSLGLFELICDCP